MKKRIFLSFVLVIVLAGAALGADGTAKPAPADNVLATAGVSSWVPDPLGGSHSWKKFFSDEKHTPSKKTESTWYYDSKTVLEPKAETLTLKEKVLGSEGATLVWVKVIGAKPSETRYLFYGLWQANAWSCSLEFL